MNHSYLSVALLSMIHFIASGGCRLRPNGKTSAVVRSLRSGCLTLAAVMVATVVASRDPLAEAAPLEIMTLETVQLPPGTHQFDSVTIHPGGTLEVELNERTVINVLGDFQMLRGTNPVNELEYHAIAKIIGGVGGGFEDPSVSPVGDRRATLEINAGGSIFIQEPIPPLGQVSMNFLNGSGEDGVDGGSGTAHHGKPAPGAADVEIGLIRDVIVLSAADTITFDMPNDALGVVGRGGNGGDGGDGPPVNGSGGDGGDGANLYLQARTINLDGRFDLRGGHGGDAGVDSSSSSATGGNGGDGGDLRIRTVTFNDIGATILQSGGTGGSDTGGVGGGAVGSDGQYALTLVGPNASLANGNFNAGLGLFLQSATGNGSANVVEADGNSLLEMSVETGNVSVSQLTNTDGVVPLLIEMDYSFLTPAGTLQALLGETEILNLTPIDVTSAFGDPDVGPSSAVPGFNHVSLAIDNPSLLALGVTDLTLQLLPGSLATVQVDNLVFTPVPEPNSAVLLLLAIGALSFSLRRCRSPALPTSRHDVNADGEVDAGKHAEGS